MDLTRDLFYWEVGVNSGLDSMFFHEPARFQYLGVSLHCV